MPSEFGFGFGVLDDRIGVYELLCETFTIDDQGGTAVDAEEVTVTFEFHPDVLVSGERITGTRTMSEDDFLDLLGSSVYIGPLRLLYTIEHGTGLEICGGWMRDEEASSAHVLECMATLDTLRNQQRIPAQVPLKCYHWY
jgi:hypothetical protein